MVLMLTAAAIGLLCYYLAEAKHRRAFLEAKQSLEVKMVIEEQSAEQVSEIVHVYIGLTTAIGKAIHTQHSHLMDIFGRFCQ